MGFNSGFKGLITSLNHYSLEVNTRTFNFNIKNFAIYSHDVFIVPYDVYKISSTFYIEFAD